MTFLFILLVLVLLCGYVDKNCSDRETSMMFQRSEYSLFALKSMRLLSFQTWLSYMSQKPEDLAEAGFFYTGVGDRTMCFHCGGGLKDWEENDEPVQEHALWFSQCAYIRRLLRGRILGLKEK